MNDITAKPMTIDTIERQKNYVAAQQQKGQGLGLVFADAFLRGMRDLGYKNPAWALAELVDNSFQAAADTVEIRFLNDESKGQVKPRSIAIIDNGNGIFAGMLSYAVRWGGTDREGDRSGFGRYGYGLPSSAVSLAKRYTVLSKERDAGWHAVTVDIGELAAVAGDPKKTEELLTARPVDVPKWVHDAKNGDDRLDLTKMESGTVIVLEDLDRLNRLPGWITSNALQAKLLSHFGVIYRHWFPERRLTVDGVAAQAVDPLFLMEHGRHFDETPVRAERVETRSFEVETSRGTKGMVTLRASVLPPNFQLKDPSRYQYGEGSKKGDTNKRHEIMKDYNGLLICRERRQIDCIPPRWTKFQTYDANIKIEIDFDPELDEFFGITTAKQQIVIDEKMWEQLQHAGKNGGGLSALVKDLRAQFTKLQKELDRQAKSKQSKDEPRPSEAAMDESEKYKGAPPEPTPAQAEEAARNLQHEAKQRAEASGRPEEEVLEDLKTQTAKRRWELEFATIPEGPFYRPTRLGTQKRLVINLDHPFYTKVYQPTQEVQPALEVLLFVLAERELEAKGEAEVFYKAERQRWSERLRHALDTLVTEESMVNKAAAVAELLHADEDEEAAA